MLLKIFEEDFHSYKKITCSNNNNFLLKLIQRKKECHEDSNEAIVKIGGTVEPVPGVHWRARIRALVFRGSEKCRRPRQSP